jgi:hypothetical protein
MLNEEKDARQVRRMLKLVQQHQQGLQELVIE